MKIRPIRQHIVVQRIDEPDRAGGAIVLPDSAKEKSTRATVIAVGSGRLLDDGKSLKPEVKAGDEVLISRHGGTDVELDEREYVVLDEGDILGILR